jgi:hypothetical protein
MLTDTKNLTAVAAQTITQSVLWLQATGQALASPKAKLTDAEGHPSMGQSNIAQATPLQPDAFTFVFEAPVGLQRSHQQLPSAAAFSSATSNTSRWAQQVNGNNDPPPPPPPPDADEYSILPTAAGGGERGEAEGEEEEGEEGAGVYLAAFRAIKACVQCA